MKDRKFNYYLEKKENVIKMLESYFDAVKQQEEENSKCKILYEREKNKIRNDITPQRLIQSKIRNDRRDKLDSLKNELIKERELNIKNIRKKSRFIENILPIAIVVILTALSPDIEMLVQLIITIPLLTAFLRVMDLDLFVYIVNKLEEKRVNKIKKEYEEKIRHVEEIHYNKEYPEEYDEAYRKEQELLEQMRIISDKFNSIYDNNNIHHLRKKFNVPEEIIGYEEVVYNLLINNRVDSFNGALEKVEVYKHRKYMEDMQHQQYLETENLRTQLDRELSDMNDKFNEEFRSMSNKFDENKKLMDRVADLASEASSSADAAASYARKAAYKS